MSQYFDHVTKQLHSKIAQAKVYITKHNPTTGALAEAVLREFLQEHLPGAVSVEQGFIITPDGGLSKQCDILIYDSHRYAPFYRAGDVVVVPAESVIALIEVKTSIDKARFHEVITYFQSFASLQFQARTYLFMFNAPQLETVRSHFFTYEHPGNYKEFDHDTYQYLPDVITGLYPSYHLEKGYVTFDRDGMGYLSYFYEDQKGSAISALELFFVSVYSAVEQYLDAYTSSKLPPRSEYHKNKTTTKIAAFDLFPCLLYTSPSPRDS